MVEINREVLTNSFGFVKNMLYNVDKMIKKYENFKLL